MITIASALHHASSYKDEWHAKYQGPLVDIRAEVWACGDDQCNCTEAQIVARYRNLSDQRWIVSRMLWRGEFHTDGEWSATEEELEAKRIELLATEPEMAAQILWPA